MTPVTEITGIGPSLAALLTAKGIKTAEKFAATAPAKLTAIPGIGARRAELLLVSAAQLVAASSAGEPEPDPKAAKSGGKATKKKAGKASKDKKADKDKKKDKSKKKKSGKKAKTKSGGKSSKGSKGKKKGKAKKK